MATWRDYDAAMSAERRPVAIILEPARWVCGKVVLLAHLGGMAGCWGGGCGVWEGCPSASMLE